MKRAEFIELNEVHTTAIEFSNLYPIKKSLYIYYKDLFCCEPVLMVTDVFNAAQYVKIVPLNEFNESIYAYLDVPYIIEDENEEGFDEDLFAQFETINFNSKLLKDIL